MADLAEFLFPLVLFALLFLPDDNDSDERPTDA